MKSKLQTINFLLLCVASITVLTTSSCKKESTSNNNNNNITTTCGIDPTAIKATIDGGAFSNQTYNLVAGTNCLLLYSSLTDTLGYINSSGTTTQNANAEVHFLVEFIGNSMGDYTIIPPSGANTVGHAYVQIDIIITGGATTTLYSQSGTLKITELGSSGGKISASFNGTFTDINNNTYTITNGFASGKRT